MQQQVHMVRRPTRHTDQTCTHTHPPGGIEA
jgi:hypothetical protein